LLAATLKARGAELATYASALVTVAPGRAVDALTPRLARAPSRERRALRVFVARAAAEKEAAPSVRRLLTDASLPVSATLDLLRAVGPRITAFGPDAHAALARLSGDPAFRTRYLLLEPAALLAPVDPLAKQLLDASLAGSKEPRLRTRALDVAPRSAAYGPIFQSALADDNVRVREAAARALGEGRFAAGSPALSSLLENDAWPIARRAAAVSLGYLADDPASRATLLEALEDPAPWVRAAAAESLGLRRSPGASEPLRERLEDREERVEVRRAAALSLGALCDAASVDLLEKLGKRIADPISSAEDRAIGEASLYALIQIHPADLERRLAPLMQGGTARTVARAKKRVGDGCLGR
jgi:HEAT repeat protein